MVSKSINSTLTVENENCLELSRTPIQLVENTKSRDIVTWPHDNTRQEVMSNSCSLPLGVSNEQVLSNSQRSAVSIHHELKTPRACD